MTPTKEHDRHVKEQERAQGASEQAKVRRRQMRAREGEDCKEDAGALTADQITDLKTVFDAFATSFDGPEPEADATNFADMWRALKGNPTTRDIKVRFEGCDVDHNGKLNFAEFQKFCAPVMHDGIRGFEQIIEQNIEAALEKLDVDHDGHIEITELKALLTMEGHDILDAEEINDVITLLHHQGVTCMKKKQLAAFIMMN